MDLNVFINAMKKRAAGMPQKPAAGNFVAPQLQSLPKAIDVQSGTAAAPVEQAMVNEGVTPEAKPSDLQMLTESLNNITKLEEMKQKALAKQPQATDAAASGAAVAQATGSMPQEQPSPAVAGKSALFGLPAKTASADAVKQVAMLLKKAVG